MLIKHIFHILPLSLLLIFSGILLVNFKKRLGLFMVCAGFLACYIFSLFPIAGLLLQPLQNHYVRYNPHHSSATHVEFIVVLGGWHKTNAAVPLSSQLGQTSLTSIIEAISLYYSMPGSRLILSGGHPDHDQFSNAEMMKKMALSLNVPSKDIILETKPQNTEEEVETLDNKLRGKSFVLVTSASHMLRALNMFHKHNLYPIAAPVNYHIYNNISFSLFPSATALQTSDIAMHEYIGIFWYWLNEKFK